MQDKLIEYIQSEFISDPDIKIDGDTKLISSGLIDSFSLVSLQRFIEREFGKLIPAPKITAENFDTINHMIEIIKNY